MSWFTKKTRPNLSASLRVLCRRVLDEGEPLFRVMCSNGFKVGDFDTRNEAEDRALDFASFTFGDSVFVSERRKLDGVQIQVSCKEFSFSFLDNGSIPS